METTKDNIDRIKQTLRWFPGVILGLGRQVGKTSALLEVIHDDHSGNATVFSPNRMMSENVEMMYRRKYPSETVPNFVAQADKLRGRSDAVFADEWWFIPTEERRKLIGTGRLVARIGTEFTDRSVDSSVIRFTDEEVNCLDAMLEVLVNGGGQYMMLGIPEIVKIHRDLFRKFRAAKKATAEEF